MILLLDLFAVLCMANGLSSAVSISSITTVTRSASTQSPAPVAQFDDDVAVLSPPSTPGFTALSESPTVVLSPRSQDWYVTCEQGYLAQCTIEGQTDCDREGHIISTDASCR